MVGAYIRILEKCGGSRAKRQAYFDALDWMARMEHGALKTTEHLLWACAAFVIPKHVTVYHCPGLMWGSEATPIGATYMYDLKHKIESCFTEQPGRDP